MNTLLSLTGYTEHSTMISSIVKSALGGFSVVSGIKTLLIITAYIAPYLFIPAVFKWSGSALGNLSGMINNRSKGVFDRSRNYRANTRKQNFANAAAKNRFQSGKLLGSKKLGDAANRRVQSAFLGAGIIASGRGTLSRKKMSARIDNARNFSSEGEIDKVAESIAKMWAGNDPMVRAAKFFKREQIRASLESEDEGKDEKDWSFRGPRNSVQTERAIDQIIESQRGVSEAGFQKARQRMQIRTGTGYQRDVYKDGNENIYNKEMYDNMSTEERESLGMRKAVEFNAEDMLNDINIAYGDDRMGAGKAMAEAKSALLNAGQIAGQASFSTWKTQLDNMWRSKTDPTTGTVARGFDSSGKRITGQDAFNERVDPTSVIMRDAINSAPPGYYASMRPATAETAGRYHAERIQRLTNSAANGTTIDFGDGRSPRVATDQDVATATAAARQILESLNQSAPQIADRFAETFMSAPIAQLDSFKTRTTVKTDEPELDENNEPKRTLDGEIIYKTKVIESPAPKTIRQLVEVVPMLDETITKGYNERRFDYGSGTVARSAEEAARSAAGGPGGKPPEAGVPKPPPGL